MLGSSGPRFSGLALGRRLLGQRLEFALAVQTDYCLAMCLICIDLQRGAMKLHEARRALGEMRASLSPQHVREVEELLDDADKRGSGTDSSTSS